MSQPPPLMGTLSTAVVNPSVTKKSQEGEHKHGASRLRGGGAGKVCDTPIIPDREYLI